MTKPAGLLDMNDFEDFSEMDNIMSLVFRDPEAPNPHKRALRSVAVCKVDFIVPPAIQPGNPMRLDFPVFFGFCAGGDFAEPSAI